MTTRTLPDNWASLENAHKHSAGHRAAIVRSKTCACFYCLATFTPDEIAEWIDNGSTALCPKCSVDSVLGDAAFNGATDPKLVEQMQRYWFGDA